MISISIEGVKYKRAPGRLPVTTASGNANAYTWRVSYITCARCRECWCPKNRDTMALHQYRHLPILNARAGCMTPVDMPMSVDEEARKIPVATAERARRSDEDVLWTPNSSQGNFGGTMRA